MRREIGKFLYDADYQQVSLDGEKSSLFVRPLDADGEYPRFHLEVFFNPPLRFIFHLDQRPHRSSPIDNNLEITKEIKRLKEELFKMSWENPEKIRKISGALRYFLLFGNEENRPTLDRLAQIHKKFPLRGISKKKQLNRKYQNIENF